MDGGGRLAAKWAGVGTALLAGTVLAAAGLPRAGPAAPASGDEPAAWIERAAGVPIPGTASDTVVGSWQGRLELPGASLRLVFHLERSEDGTLAGSMDSPDQGATGVPLSGVSVSDGGLTLEVAAIGGEYRGELFAGGDSLRGRWSQSGRSFPLRLGRLAAGEEAAGPRRPQTPEPPFPYRSEEVVLEGAGAGPKLAGTLTVPEGEGPFPGVALLSGSGPQDRDGTLFGHRPFLVLADRLARAGVAVLRWDDRGVGGSGGDLPAATLDHLAEDARAWIRWLEARPEVDPGRTGLLGHSEGAWVAALAAAGDGGGEGPGEPTGGTDRTSGADFVVLLAGPGVPGDSLLHLQRDALLEAAGAAPAAVRAQRALVERIFEVLRAHPDTAAASARLEAAYEEVRNALAGAEREALERSFTGGARETLRRQFGAMNTRWFRSFLAFDPRPVLRRLTVPVLAVVGGRDLQVPPEPNLAALREALGAASRPEVTVREMEGLNHLLQPARTGLPGEYGSIETTLAPEVLDLVAEWIREWSGRAAAGGAGTSGEPGA